MNKYTFGKNSQSKIDQGYIDIGKILTLAISRSSIDFGVSCVLRLFEDQLAEFMAVPKRTTLDPRNPKLLKSAMHVVTDYRPEAMAFDIYIYHPDTETRKKLIYDKPSLAHVFGIIQCCAIELFEKGETTHLVRWGGNWDRDGVILLDQSFDDLPHGELYKPG